jgi:hypothetical protein
VLLNAAPTSTQVVSPLVEACDGGRSKADDAGALSCTRWKVEWTQGGKVWGLSSGATMDEVLAERDRQVGFARKYARFFDKPIDPRFATPTEPICDACKDTTAAGRWGTGQKFSGAASKQAVADAQGKIDALRTALATHAANVTDTARLSREKNTAKQAKKYATQLEQAMVEVAAGQLAVDNAAALRESTTANKVGTSAAARKKTLDDSLAVLATAVAKEVARAHGGRYLEDNANGPFLEVKFENAKVVATYVTGPASSTWFEGAVALDGSVTGKSLVAPEKGTLKCKEHTVDCGFVHVPAVLRFSERPGTDEKKPRQVAELWFQQSQWVAAKPFSR